MGREINGPGLHRKELQRLSSNPLATLLSTWLASALFERASRNGIDHIPIQKFSRIGAQMFLSPLWGSVDRLPNAPTPGDSYHLPWEDPLRLRPPWLCCTWVLPPPHSAVATQHSFICQLNPGHAGPVGHSWWQEAQISDELNTMQQHSHTTIMKSHARC